jgi:hypothetical protein
MSELTQFLSDCVVVLEGGIQLRTYLFLGDTYVISSTRTGQ